MVVAARQGREAWQLGGGGGQRGSGKGDSVASAFGSGSGIVRQRGQQRIKTKAAAAEAARWQVSAAEVAVVVDVAQWSGAFKCHQRADVCAFILGLGWRDNGAIGVCILCRGCRDNGAVDVIVIGSN